MPLRGKIRFLAMLRKIAREMRRQSCCSITHPCAAWLTVPEPQILWTGATPFVRCFTFPMPIKTIRSFESSRSRSRIMRAPARRSNYARMARHLFRQRRARALHTEQLLNGTSTSFSSGCSASALLRGARSSERGERRIRRGFSCRYGALVHGRRPGRDGLARPISFEIPPLAILEHTLSGSYRTRL